MSHFVYCVYCGSVCHVLSLPVSGGHPVGDYLNKKKIDRGSPLIGSFINT